MPKQSKSSKLTPTERAPSQTLSQPQQEMPKAQEAMPSLSETLSNLSDEQWNRMNSLSSMLAELNILSTLRRRAAAVKSQESRLQRDSTTPTEMP